MNSTRFRSRRPAPAQYVARRLSSILVVAAAFGGGLAVGVLHDVGVPVGFSLAIGLILFLAVATLLASIAVPPAHMPFADAADGSLGDLDRK